MWQVRLKCRWCYSHSTSLAHRVKVVVSQGQVSLFQLSYMHCRRQRELTGGPRSGCSTGTSEEVAVKIISVAANEFAQTVLKKKMKTTCPSCCCSSQNIFSPHISTCWLSLYPSRGYKASDAEGSTSVIDLKLVDII